MDNALEWKPHKTYALPTAYISTRADRSPDCRDWSQFERVHQSWLTMVHPIPFLLKGATRLITACLHPSLLQTGAD